MFLSLLLLMVVILVAHTLGSWLTSLFRIKVESREERFTLSIGLGLGLFMLLILILGLSGNVSAEIFRVVLLILLLIALPVIIRGLRELFSPGGFSLKWMNGEEKFLCLIIISFLAVDLISSLVPVISSDEMNHHLFVPRLWLQAGGIQFIPFNFFSAFPNNLQMLYLFALGIGGDTLAKLIHFSCGLLTLLLIYGLGKRLSGRSAGLMGSLFFLLMPMFTFLSGTAQVDFGLTLYATLTIVLILYGLEKNQFRYFLFAGVCAGLTCGIKHQGVLLIPLFPLIFFLKRWSVRDVCKAAFAFFLPAMAVGCIWYVIAFAWTGNPVYPLLYGVFKGVYLSPRFETAFGNMMDSVGGKAFDPLHLISLPFALTFNLENWEYALAISPFFLAFLPAVFGIRKWEERHSLPVKLFLLFSAGYFLLSLLLFNHHPRRLLMPILPVLSVSIAIGLERLIVERTVRRVILGLIGLIALVQVPYEIYLLKHYLPSTIGLERKENFLKRTVDNFSFVEKVNAHLPPSAITFVPFGEAYYFSSPVITGYPLFSGGYTDYSSFSSPEELRRHLMKLGVQYIIYEEGASIVGDMATNRTPNAYVEHAYGLLRGLKENFTEEVLADKRYHLLKLL